MSPASYLTAPPRVAASIVAPRARNRAPRRPRYDARIGYLTWISLLFLAVAIISAGVVAFVRGRRLWRTIGSFGGELTEALAAVEKSAASAEARAGALADGSERLQASLARLELSLAQLAVLRGAADELRADVRRARSVVPRK